ncbi:L,D-transpeptidase family protein [Ornithinibacillus sp. L9]|uniref:L,D-transpeptidase family protein n=1 Tax=Ornithinibacillus caprae TaxID=2678566 RepID=A0A6N8FFR9_9BACI|nr:L,D-transpeptidase family protein [Ornithinibacillus caprae]MUK88400.1 L,D-transpeptidase family protein [Ornithinibacillus caprae]
MSADADSQVIFIPRAERHKKKKRKRSYLFVLLLVIVFVVVVVLSRTMTIDQTNQTNSFLATNLEGSTKMIIQKQANGLEKRFQVKEDQKESNKEEEQETVEKDENEDIHSAVTSDEVNEAEEVVESSEKNEQMEAITADFVLEHKVKKQETLFSITMLYYASGEYQKKVQAYNGITNPEREIMEGITLQIPDPHYMVVHKVDRGESLLSISKKYYGTEDYAGSLAQYNEIKNPNHLPYDTLLHIPNPSSLQRNVPIFQSSPEKPSYRIVINKKSNQLTVYDGNSPIKSFAVGTGKDVSKTPEGEFKIINKIEKPWYRAQEIPGGDPNNPLGSHWLGLNVPGTDGTIYGIHGTNDPSTIGKYVSLGCIRMNNSDVEWLYNNLPLGTSVRIINK